MLNPDPKSRLNRAIFWIAGCVFIGSGLTTFQHGHLLSYENWWGGLVFGPFAIIFGVIFIAGAIFKPTIFKARSK
jgi:hypothetical protein